MSQLLPSRVREEPERATLADGSVILIRAILVADAGRLCRMFDRLSPTSIYRRYLAPVTRASARALLTFADLTVRLRNGEYEIRVRPDALRPSRPPAGLPEREGRR